MAIFSVEIADQDVSRVIDAICYNYAWQEHVLDPVTTLFINNPETKPVFANRMVREFLREHVVKYETEKAIQRAKESLNLNPVINDPQL